MILGKKHLMIIGKNLNNTGKPINVSNGSSNTMKKKYSNRFNPVSSKQIFSVNGIANHSYIYNATPMEKLRNYNCYVDIYDTKNDVKVSVKSSFAMQHTRLKSDGNLYCNPVISKMCQDQLYKDKDGNILNINKHLRSENRSQSLYIDRLKDNSCNYVESDDQESTKKIVSCSRDNNKTLTTVGYINYLKRGCTIDKNDLSNSATNSLKVKVIDYSDYLTRIKNLKNCYNPKDVRVIAC